MSKPTTTLRNGSFCPRSVPSTRRRQSATSVTMGMPSKSQKSREEASFETRVAAAELAKARGSTPGFSNGEELSLRDADGKPSLIASFTKGLAHADDTSIIDPADFITFVRASNSGSEVEIAMQPLGPEMTTPDGKPIWRSPLANKLELEVRGWENQSAGLSFDLEGPDAQSVAMPPAPLLTSPEATAELAELYLMALAREIPFTAFDDPKFKEFFDFALGELNSLEWFSEGPLVTDTEEEARRRRGPFTVDSIFRGILPGSEIGPYISQYLVIGTPQLGSAMVGVKKLVSPNAGDEFEGVVKYGSITLSQKVRIATEGRDFMVDPKIFLDVQDAADFRGFETYEKGARLITTLRDLATWVHFDALYEAYLNACLILLAQGVPFDPNLPFQMPDKIDKQDVFVNFGSAHILSLVCEVATRALKAVRYQKFLVHRRLRPEAAGGLVHANKTMGAFPELDKLVKDLGPILEKVGKANLAQNKADAIFGVEPAETFFLPQAFAEGSPFHPSYGSGHATVAGACVTVLKAFFDAGTVIEDVFQVNPYTSKLEKAPFTGTLTVEGELNKLADNVSVGRDVAGVHWFSDQFESLLLGEEIAIGILEEQKLTFGENFFFTLPKFDGTTIFI